MCQLGMTTMCMLPGKAAARQGLPFCHDSDYVRILILQAHRFYDLQPWNSQVPFCNAYNFCGSREGCGSGCLAMSRAPPRATFSHPLTPYTTAADDEVTFTTPFYNCQESAMEALQDRWRKGACMLLRTTAPDRPALLASVDGPGWRAATLTPLAVCNGLMTLAACEQCRASNDFQG